MRIVAEVVTEGADGLLADKCRKGHVYAEGSPDGPLYLCVGPEHEDGQASSISSGEGDRRFLALSRASTGCPWIPNRSQRETCRFYPMGRLVVGREADE